MKIFGFEIKKISSNSDVDVFADFLNFKLKEKKPGCKTMPLENQAIKPIAFKMLENLGANPISSNGGTHIYGTLHNVRIDLWPTTQKMFLSVIGNKKEVNGKQGIVEALKKLKETKSF